MHASRILLFALLPLFASCQVFSEKPKVDSVKHSRLQGELSLDAGQLLFRPCQEQRRFVIANDGATGIMRDAAELLADGPGRCLPICAASWRPASAPASMAS